jgi:hypothetical protein
MNTGAHKEIDLLDIAVSMVRSVIKNLTWVILITLSCVIGGYLTSKFSSAYEGQLMIKGRGLKASELAFFLLEYQRGGIPGITGQEASSIKDFSFAAHTENPQINERESFATITVKANDSTLFQKIQSGIVAGLNDEKMVNNYYTLFNQIDSALITEYKDNISRAEVLIERKADKESVALFPEVMNMWTKLKEIEAVYEKPLITAVNDFVPVHTQLSALKTSAIGLLIGMALSFAFIMMRGFIVYYKKVTAGT